MTDAAYRDMADVERCQPVVDAVLDRFCPTGPGPGLLAGLGVEPPRGPVVTRVPLESHRIQDSPSARGRLR